MKIISLLILLSSCIFSQVVIFPVDTIVANHLFNNRQFIAYDSDGILHVAFYGQSGTNSNTSEIFYGKENETGNFDNIQITTNETGDNYPTLSFDASDNVHIGFTGRDINGLYQIQYTNNISGTFSTPFYITTGGLNKATPFSKVGKDSIIHFVYFTYTSGVDNVYYRNYNFITGLLSNEVFLVSSETGGDFDAALDVDLNGHVHIVVKSGNGFSGPLKYFNNTSGSIAEYSTGVSVNVSTPRISIDNHNYVHIVYRHEAVYRLEYINNKTGNFSTPVQITPAGQRPSFSQNIAIDDSNRVYVIYQSSVATSGRGFYFVYGKDGNFSDTLNIYDIKPPYVTRNQSAVAARKNGELALTFAQGAVINSVVLCDILISRVLLFDNPVLTNLTGNLDFGDVYTGIKDTLIVELKNTGTGDLQINNFEIDNSAFTLGLTTPYIIPFDSTVNIPVYFLPADTIDYTGNLKIFSNSIGTNPVEIELNGTGLGRSVITFNKLSFVLNSDNIWTDTLIVSNSGTAMGRVDSILSTINSFNGVGFISEYENFFVPPGESFPCLIMIAIPVSQNLNHDTMFVYSNDPFNSIVEIELLWEQPSSIKGSEIPKDLSLSQNYPNPFNPETIIEFSVPESSSGFIEHVSLVVYDVTGNKIAELFSGEKEPGVYKYNFNMENFASGIYLYKLSMGNKSITKKLMLLK